VQDHAALLDDIRALLALGPGDAGLARIEDTLTAGYARAMALEAEHWRLERQMAELTLSGDAEELLGLARRMSASKGDLGHLRTLLDSLRERAREFRGATTS
jgi:hypothetical protein